jgi:predicted dienelactone hydrolase
MKIFLVSLAILLCSHLTVTTAAARELLTLQRQDGKSTNVMVYKPSGGECQGVAMISHGAGGSENGYAYLGAAIADFGYLALVVGHHESGPQAVQDKIRGKSLSEGLANLITESKAYHTRFMDLSAAKEWAQSQCNSQVAVLLGHSMGAATVMMAAGSRNKLNISQMPMYSAYIALSPQGSGLIFPVNAWSEIQHPVLMLTGTKDQELGGLSWESRTEPFMNMQAGCKWIAVIDGSTHMNFAGMGFSKKTEALTIQVIRDFLKGVHDGDCQRMTEVPGMKISSK